MKVLLLICSLLFILQFIKNMFDELLYFYIFMYPKANMMRNRLILHMVMFNLVPMSIKEF